MRGSSTIAEAAFACHWSIVFAQHGLGLRLDRVVDRERDALALARGRGLEDVDRLARRVPDHRLAPVLSGQDAFEPELEPGEPVVVRPRVADDLRRDVAERIDALLLVGEAEADDALLLQDLHAAAGSALRAT